MSAQYDLKVHASELLTPHMRRITLEGEALRNFPVGEESGYVKLLLRDDSGSTVLRSYTVRGFDPQRRHLMLDFVDHGDNGPASAWANHCRPGDAISVRGPGAKKLAAHDADWFLLAGDMSALPALGVNLERLPADATGHAVIEVLSEDDKQTLSVPAGMTLQWIVNPDASAPNRPLVDAVAALDWLPGTPYPWFAGEFDAMRRIRRLFRDEKGIDRRAMYLSCYWKLGDTDEGMKQAKRRDAERDAEAEAAAG